MATLCADWKTMDLCADAQHQRKLSFNLRKQSDDYNPAVDAIHVMTMKVSKGLEFPVVALPEVGHMPAAGEDEKETARVFSGVLFSCDKGYEEISDRGRVDFAIWLNDASVQNTAIGQLLNVTSSRHLPKSNDRPAHKTEENQLHT